MDVVVDEEDEERLESLMGEDQESRFYTCHVCGDNWLSVKEVEMDGECTITFVHQMGMAPVLKRIAHMETPVLVNEDTVDWWKYFLDDEEVGERVWYDKLSNRRKILKSICTN